MTHDIFVALSAGIVYVYGTVNGAAVDFQLYEGNIWRAAADRADDGIYEIEITAYDELDRWTTYRVTKFHGRGFITDRMRSDVIIARANRNSPANLKGAMNVSDWIRITGAVHNLSEIFAWDLGIVVPVYCKNQWTMTDIPTYEIVAQIIADMENLQTAFIYLREVPAMPWNHFEKINEAERILSEMYNTVDLAFARFRRSGTFYAGQAESLPLGGGF